MWKYSSTGPSGGCPNSLQHSIIKSRNVLNVKHKNKDVTIVMELKELMADSVPHHSELHLKFNNINESEGNDQVKVILHPK